LISDFPAHSGISSESAAANPQSCPLHSSRTPTLWLLNDNLAGPYFRCLHSDCRFVGTPADLLQAVRKLSVQESLAAFGAGGEFEGCFGQPASDAVIQAKLKPATDQAQLHAYFKECRQLLRLHGQNVMMPLQSDGILPDYLLSTACGMACPQTPAVLDMLPSAEYVNNDLLIMPYSSGPCITSLATYNPLTTKLEHYVLQDQPGIFMERELSWPTVSQIMLCNNELDALAIYSSAQTLSSIPVNPVVVNDCRVLLDLPDLQRVELVTHPRSPLRLADVLHCWRTLANRSISLQILDLDESPARTKAAVLLNHEEKLLDLWPWVADRIQGYYKEGRDALIRVLGAATLGDLDREFLLAELKRRENVDPGLIETVEYVKSMITDKSINNCLVRRDGQGYHLLLPQRKQLTNFTLHTSRFVTNPAGGIEAHCRVQVDGRLLPGEVRLPATLLHSGNRRLKHAIWQQLSEINKQLPTRLQANNLPNFDWLDLLQAFDAAEFCRGVDQLGSKEGRIDFPHFYIDTQKFSVSPLRTGLFVNEKTQRLYNALSAGGDLADYRQLFASTHPAAAGIGGALAHIIHHFVARLTTGREVAPKHLIFATSSEDRSLWEGPFRQLCNIFTMAPFNSEIRPATKFREQIAAYDGLGDLPLLCRIGGAGRKLDNWLDSCTYPVIALADTKAAQSLGRLPNASVTVWDQQAFAKAKPARLEASVITKLQQGWLPFLAKCLQEFRAKDEEIYSPVPAATAYAWICNLFGLPLDAGVISMFEQYPVIAGINLVDEFFAGVRKLLAKEYAVSSAERRSKNNLLSLGWHTASGDITIRSSRTLRYVNAKLAQPLDPRAVEEALVAANLASVKVSRYRLWIFPAAVWNERVLLAMRRKYAPPLLKLS